MDIIILVHSDSGNKQTRVLKLYSIVIAVALTSVLIGGFLYLSFSTGMDLESDTLTTIVNILYILGNGSLLIPAIIVFWNINKRDIFLLHRMLLTLFIIINMLADIAFTYHITLVDEETFIHQDWYPALYTISYIMYVVGLIWYNKISSIMNTNIQKTMDKNLPVMKTLWKKKNGFFKC